MKALFLSLQFLTIIPVKVKGEISEKEIGEASAFVPLVGAFQGALLVTANLILIKVFPAELTNGFLVLLLVLSNGGFHLDGLADTFDATAIKSSGNSEKDREKRLTVMKDSTIGPIGVIAIILVILLKFLALNSLSHFSLSTFHFSLLLMPVFARWAMVPAMFHGKSARQDGLGKIFIENTGLKELVIATLSAVGCWLLVVSFSSLVTRHSLFSFLPLVTGHWSLFLLPLPALYLFSFASTKFFHKNFGGLTGDTLGAISEVSEVLFLLILLPVTRYSSLI